MSIPGFTSIPLLASDGRGRVYAAGASGGSNVVVRFAAVRMC
jgi:hypothetical protein